MRVAKPVDLTDEERASLIAYASSRRAAARVVERAKIILAAAEGTPDIEIAEDLRITRQKAARWRKRFLVHRLAGIERDAPRPGRLPKVTEAKAREVVAMTLEAPKNATHWSCRELAKVVGLAPSTILRIWRANGLKPHLEKKFKLSRDPRFAEKLEDIVGLYIRPPEHAIVLCADEKSQIQALDRTQPMLPFNQGHCATTTHDYVRNGTTTLFAAMNTLDGTVIGKCMAKHRHQEWIKFLKLVDQSVTAGKRIHLICDNYSTHKHENVKRWLARHPRFKIHFTPTGASWLNMVERFFRDLTQKRIRRGAFRSVYALIEAIKSYIDGHNDAPKPFIWTAKATDILEKVVRARRALPHK